MINNVSCLVPLLSSQAGLCLSSANWQEASINTLSYHLDELLFKPGLNLLKEMDNLNDYLAWPGKIVLNASHLLANKAGVYTITSSYDGSKLQLTHVELIQLIQHLKPDLVLLPKNIMQHDPDLWSNWNNAIVPLLSEEDVLQGTISVNHGIYLSPNDHLMKQLDRHSDLVRYVFGTINLDLMHQLNNKSVDYIESDTPAMNALCGIVYTNKGTLDLKDKTAELHFEPIAADCNCPTCKQGFTKAYLHHLLEHTPLLCHRFLIQHNVYYLQKRVLI